MRELRRGEALKVFTVSARQIIVAGFREKMR